MQSLGRKRKVEMIVRSKTYCFDVGALQCVPPVISDKAVIREDKTNFIGWSLTHAGSGGSPAQSGAQL